MAFDPEIFAECVIFVGMEEPRRMQHRLCEGLVIVALVLSNRLGLPQRKGPIHVSKLALKAPEARKHWLTIEWLPTYASELNDIEVVWHNLKNPPSAAPRPRPSATDQQPRIKCHARIVRRIGNNPETSCALA